MSYLVQTIKQSYKVIFSMQLLGDPSYVLHQYKTGVREFFTKTRDEIAAGGKDGAGKGVSSLLQNVVGGTAFMFGKISGGAADTVRCCLHAFDIYLCLALFNKSDSLTADHHFYILASVRSA